MNGSTKDEKRQEYIIDGLAVNVIVNMERIIHSIPADVQFCGGKMNEDKVNVKVSPSNEKVEEVVAAHFKSQVVELMFMPTAIPVFDEVVINGRKVI
jgi:hypothetical protein